MKLVLGLDGAGKTMLLRQLSHTCKDEFHNPKLGSDFEKVRIRLFTDSASVAEVDGIDVATLPTTGCQKTVEKVGVQNRVDADFGARAAVHGGGAWIFRQTEKLMMRSLCRSSSYDGVSGTNCMQTRSSRPGVIPMVAVIFHSFRLKLT
ncbi:hypothetical protein DYB35_013652 [Aphanomyces astaci]|uniref:Uncharacterized protein n=1 Tax=Aphanomyces astaci TaxID=112090 RepID=A0A3R7B6F1_APHAT|nr:hypothetical protein DYB35_013652 [Aphanomyces astaci]